MRNAAVRELTWACCIKRLWPPSQKADPALPEPAPPAAHLNVALLSSAEGGAGPGADILPPVPEPSQSEPKVPPKPPGRTIGAWLQPGAFSRSLFNSFIYSFSRMRTAFESTPCMLVCVCEKQHTFFFFLKLAQFCMTLVTDSKRCGFIYTVIDDVFLPVYVFSPLTATLKRSLVPCPWRRLCDLHA